MTQVYHHSVLISTTEASWKEAQEVIQKTFTKISNKFVYQVELGPATKKWHFQCYINLKQKKRSKSLMKTLNALLDGSVRCKPSSTAGKKSLQMYCMKPETRQAGPWADRPIYLGADLPTTLRPWQQNLLDLLSKAPDKRKIYWLYDSKGGRGKSTLCKYLWYHRKILTLTFGNAGDLLNLVSKMPGRAGYIFDLSRTKGAKTAMADIYQAMESVKNGYFINTKYECSVCCFNIPHVIVFSNAKPDVTALSLDRWEIIDMSQMSQGIL